jgi:hypothetical protein
MTIMQTGRRSRHHLLMVNFFVPFNKESEKLSFANISHDPKWVIHNLAEPDHASY